jgi:chromosome partitioning protein
VRAATRSARLTREILADMGVSLLEAQIPLRESLATSFGTIPSGDNPYRVVLDELMTKELAA